MWIDHDRRSHSDWTYALDCAGFRISGLVASIDFWYHDFPFFEEFFVLGLLEHLSILPMPLCQEGREKDVSCFAWECSDGGDVSEFSLLICTLWWSWWFRFKNIEGRFC